MQKLKIYFMKKMLAGRRKKERKKYPVIGERLTIARKAGDIEVIIHMPRKRRTPLPVMFNVHGGAWVLGDAACIEGQSKRMANALSCIVVNINYTKLDVKPFPYPQQEIVDCVKYFAKRTSEYGIDVEKFSLIGYSAGGHLCAGAAQMLRDIHFPLCANVLVYPFLDFSVLGADAEANKLMGELFFSGGVGADSPLLSPAKAKASALVGLSPTEIILCGRDALYEQGISYEKSLHEAGCEATLKVFEGAMHGFMEGAIGEGDKAREQALICDTCFTYLQDRMVWHWRSIDDGRR